MIPFFCLPCLTYSNFDEESSNIKQRGTFNLSRLEVSTRECAGCQGQPCLEQFSNLALPALYKRHGGILLSVRSIQANCSTLKARPMPDDSLRRGEVTDAEPVPMISDFALWHPPITPLTLADGEVHVWLAKLDLPQQRVQELLHTLSEDERHRAAGFRFAQDRARFIVARGALRTMLGHYLGEEPKQLCFEYNAHGKPSLAGQAGHTSLRFNVSHSHEIGLCGVTRKQEIGIDVERIKPELVDEQIAERFFSPGELKTLRRLPKAAQPAAFFNCWTRKEAYLKARGTGLSLPLDQFDVSIAPGEPAALLCTQDDPQEALRWSIKELPLGPEYAAAIALEGDSWQLKYWRWPE